MSDLALVRQLLLHNEWADAELLRAFSAAERLPDAAWREYTHVLAAEELWLARMETREARVAVWPSLSLEEGGALRRRLADDYAAMLGALNEENTARLVSYMTTDGRPFTNTVGDILVHVALHGQYHRGKVNLLLRQEGSAPAPVDFIAFVRGAPAASTRDSF